MMRFNRFFVCASVVLGTMLGGIGIASASDVEQLRSRLNASREALAQFSTDPMADSAALEIERARIDIDEATERISNQLEEIAEISVIRLENRVKLIAAMIAQATVDELADERETATIEMTREADQSQVDFEATEARRSALREETSEILRQLEALDD